MDDLFQILAEALIQGRRRAVRFCQGDAPRQQPAKPRRGPYDCHWALVLFDDHLGTLLDSLQDRGDVADRFGLAEMDGSWLHIFNRTSSLSPTAAKPVEIPVGNAIR